MTKVLLADDNRVIREFCGRELEDEGYQVILARDGREALELTGSLLPDVIVLDICMPGIDGLEAAARIRAEQPNLPVILFTAYDDACVRDERARAATACVAKQTDLTELKRVIAESLRSVRETRPYRLGLPPALRVQPVA
jgi:CheY-like chemotaxis protein